MADLFTFPDPTTIPQPHRVILHWTAGKYRSTQHDRAHYHALVEWNGESIRVVQGVPISNNMHQLSSGDPTYSEDPVSGYAAHTRGFNSFSIGYSICAMFEAVDRDELGDYPLLPEQVDGLITLCAQTAVVFDLPVDQDHFFSHWEAEAIHGVPQPGKWDITYVPNAGELQAHEVGDWLRAEIQGRTGRNEEET